MLGFVGVACDLKVFLIIRPKPVGLPEPAGLVCTITPGARWDIYDFQIEMAALSRLGIRYDELLAVRAQQVVPCVAPWMASPVGTDCVGHRCSGPPAV